MLSILLRLHDLWNNNELYQGMLRPNRNQLYSYYVSLLIPLEYLQYLWILLTITSQSKFNKQSMASHTPNLVKKELHIVFVHSIGKFFFFKKMRNENDIIFDRKLIPLRAKQVGGRKFNWKKKSTKECVRLSVCLSITNFDPNYLRTGKTEWTEFFQDIVGKMNVFKKNCISSLYPIYIKMTLKSNFR